VLKMGRTQLQDAVPMTLGQEFNSFASTIAADLGILKQVAQRFLTVNMGGTAIGTGIASTSGYGEVCVRHMRAVTGMPIVLAEDLIEETANTGGELLAVRTTKYRANSGGHWRYRAGFLAFSGVLRRIAVKISKICNDLRLLSSGPRAGFNEINLPAMAPGSSIMPGKVNPVIPETVNQIAFQVPPNPPCTMHPLQLCLAVR
jgi:aspartate ammonia-lyase